MARGRAFVDCKRTCETSFVHPRIWNVTDENDTLDLKDPQDTDALVSKTNSPERTRENVSKFVSKRSEVSCCVRSWMTSLSSASFSCRWRLTKDVSHVRLQSTNARPRAINGDTGVVHVFEKGFPPFEKDLSTPRTALILMTGNARSPPSPDCMRACDAEPVEQRERVDRG